MKWEFVVEGPLMGHRCSVRHAFDLKFVHWKKMVRIIASEAGLPLELDTDKSYRVTTELFWKKTARLDGENVQKALQDSCFGRDRRVIEGHYKSYEHHGFEFAKVYVEVCNGDKQ